MQICQQATCPSKLWLNSTNFQLAPKIIVSVSSSKPYNSCHMRQSLWKLDELFNRDPLLFRSISVQHNSEIVLQAFIVKILYKVCPQRIVNEHFHMSLDLVKRYEFVSEDFHKLKWKATWSGRYQIKKTKSRKSAKVDSCLSTRYSTETEIHFFWSIETDKRKKGLCCKLGKERFQNVLKLTTVDTQ